MSLLCNRFDWNLVARLKQPLVHRNCVLWFRTNLMRLKDNFVREVNLAGWIYQNMLLLMVLNMTHIPMCKTAARKACKCVV